MTGTAEPAGDRRRRGGLALGVTAAVVAVVATPLLLLGGGKPSPRAASPQASASATPTAAVSTASPVPSAASSTLLADGQTVEASGRIVSVPGKPVRICAPVPIPAIGYLPGHEPAPAWCPLGVDVTGVDLEALQTPRTKNGATEGWGYVRGVYRSGKVSVSMQSGERGSLFVFPDLLDNAAAPCPRPSAGWHRESRGANPIMGDQVAAYGQSHPGQIESEAIFRPNDTTGVVIVAVKDLAAARAALPNDPGALCLIPAKYTATQVTAAEAPFEADQTSHATDPGGQVIGVGQGVGPDWHTLVEVQVVAMTAQVKKWAAEAPNGLVRLTPWMTVVVPGAPLPSLVPTVEQSVSPASASLYASEDVAYPSGYDATSGVAVSTSAAPSAQKSHG